MGVWGVTVEWEAMSDPWEGSFEQTPGGGESGGLGRGFQQNLGGQLAPHESEKPQGSQGGRTEKER